MKTIVIKDVATILSEAGGGGLWGEGSPVFKDGKDTYIMFDAIKLDLQKDQLVFMHNGYARLSVKLPPYLNSQPLTLTGVAGLIPCN